MLFVPQVINTMYQTCNFFCVCSLDICLHAFVNNINIFFWAEPESVVVFRHSTTVLLQKPFCQSCDIKMWLLVVFFFFMFRRNDLPSQVK